MEHRNTYPNVAIVGRTNVGKSTLFNRLTKTNQSMVFARDGVTRDYIQDVVVWNKQSFNLIDTGGLPLAKTSDLILKEVEANVIDILQSADLILFVCDVKSGLTEQDRLLAKMLHKAKKKTLMLLNKADNLTARQENEYEFYALGFDDVYNISATHGTGTVDLLDAIITNIQHVEKKEEQEPAYTITILGKPNVGKSSLLNVLLKKNRSIVSTVAGTTREAITEIVTCNEEYVNLTDTPGVRKKGKVEDPLEQEMVKRTMSSVRQADIVILMIDSTTGKISDQDLKLLFYAYEQKKSLLILYNKTDILEQEQKDMLKYEMIRYEFLLKKIPSIWISCKTGKNVHKISTEIEKIRRRRQQTFDPVECNELIKQAIIRRPMYHKRQLLKILHTKPLKTSDFTPTFVLYVNFPQWFGPTQLGFIENQIRRHYDLIGCPVNLIVQKV